MRPWKGSILVFVVIAAVIIGVFATGIISVDNLPDFGIGSSSTSDFDNVPVQSSHSGSADDNRKFNSEETLRQYVDILIKLKDNQELEGLKEGLSDIKKLEKLEPENSRVLGLKDRLEWQIKITQGLENGVLTKEFKTEENHQYYVDILVDLKDNQKTENLEESLYYIIQLEKLELDNVRVLGLKRSLEKRLKYHGVDVTKLKECFKLIDTDDIPIYDIDNIPVYDLDSIPKYDLDSIPVYDLDKIPDYNLYDIPVYDLDSIPVFNLDNIPEYNIYNIPSFNPR